MQSPPQRLLLLFLAVVFLVAFFQVGLITIAFDKLGLSPDSAMLLLFALIGGSWINLPLFKIDAVPPPEGAVPPAFQLWLRSQHQIYPGKTVVAANVGGCLIPLSFSAYLVVQGAVQPFQVLLAVGAVTVVSYVLSRPITGLGIGMPVLVAPLTAAGVALLLNPQHSAPLAYVGGTLGVIVGADVLHLNDIRKIGSPFASIGGGGTFDGIFITGIVAVLLA